VEVLLSTKISEIEGDRVLLENGTELPSDVTVWAAGVAAPEALARWGLPQGRGGRILVGPDLRVAGQDRVFAAGDIALIEDQPLPQLAQPAIQMGRHAGAAQPVLPVPGLGSRRRDHRGRRPAGGGAGRRAPAGPSRRGGSPATVPPRGLITSAPVSADRLEPRQNARWGWLRLEF